MIQKYSVNEEKSERRTGAVPIMSLSLAGTILFLKVLIPVNVNAAADIDTIQPTAVAAAVNSGIQLPSIALNGSTSQLQQVLTIETSSDNHDELLRDRIHELMNVDNREVDQVSTRLKEIIRARYEAEALNIELRRQITEFENLLGSAKDQHNLLSSPGSDLQQQLQQVLSATDNQLDDLAGQYNNLLAENKNVKLESAGVLDALNEKEKVLADLRAQINDLAAERDSANTEVAAVEGILNERADQIDQLKQKIDNLSAERDHANAELALLENKYKEADALANNVLSERNDLAGTLSLFETKAADSSNALTDEQQSHAQTKATVAALENELNDVQAELNRLAGERDTLASEKAHLEATSADLGGRLAGLEQELDTRKNSLQSALNSIGDLNTQIGSVSDERDMANERIESLQAELMTLQDNMTASQKEAENRILSAGKELNVQRAALDSELALRDQAIADRDEQLSSLNTDIENRQNEWNIESAALQDEIADKQQQILALENAVAELESRHQQLNGLKLSGDARLGEMQTEMAGLVSQRDSTAEQLEQLRIENSDLNTQLAATGSELELVTREGEENLARLTARIGELEASGASTNEEVERLSALNGELQTEIDATREKLQLVSAEGSDQVNQLMAQIADLEAQNSELKSLEVAASEKIRFVENSNNNLLEQLEESLDAGKVARDDADELQGVVSDYEARLEIANQKLRDVEAAEQLAQAERDAVVAEAESLRVALTDELNSARLEHVTVAKARADNSIPLRLGNADFFAPGSAVLTKEGGENLTRLAGIIEAYHDRRIVVEGHTDNVPIGAGLVHLYPSNWELSVARAAAAVRHMQRETKIDPLNMSAAGYGEYRPVAPNDTNEGRQQNRRVEVVLYPRTDSYKSLSALEAEAGTIEKNIQTLEESGQPIDEQNVSSMEE